MAFFASAIDTLKILVIALGAGLGAWGVVNLLEGYGKRVFSSAGSEHLPYKQRVGGSNPSTPTQRNRQKSRFLFLFIY